MPEQVLDAGHLSRYVGRTLVISGFLSLVAALVCEGEYTAGSGGAFLGIDHPASFLLCVLAVLFWVNGGALWRHGARLRPQALVEQRDDWA